MYIERDINYIELVLNLFLYCLVVEMWWSTHLNFSEEIKRERERKMTLQVTYKGIMNTNL